jgi:phosphate transport system substrate-binding protein
MAAIGYAPLPPQLSQFLADAVGYMTNQPAQQLNASNCSNPTFRGSLGADASPPPVPPIGNAPGGAAAGSASSSRGGTSSVGTGASAAATTGGTGSSNGSEAAGTSNAQSQEASKFKAAAPAALEGGQLPTSPLLPLLALLVLLAVPVVVLSVKRKREIESVKPDDSITL